MKALRAKDVMNTEVVRASDSMSIRELASFLTKQEITGAPVEDENGNLVGVVSLSDVASDLSEKGSLQRDLSRPEFYLGGWEEEYASEEIERFHLEYEDQDLLVRDIMNPVVYSVPEETLVREIAKTMIAGRIHRLMVTRDGELVGIVTTLDLLKLLA